MKKKFKSKLNALQYDLEMFVFLVQHCCSRMAKKPLLTQVYTFFVCVSRVVEFIAIVLVIIYHGLEIESVFVFVGNL